MSFPVFWKGERLDRLVELWEQGHSAAEIARILGNTTRDAVCGVARRHGLDPRPTRFAVYGEKKAPSAPRVRKPAPVLQSEPTPFAESRPGQCRFMLDDHTICGGKCESGSWCEYHHAIVFVQRRAA